MPMHRRRPSILRLGRTKKKVIVFVLDGGLCVATVLFSFYLRLNEWSFFSNEQTLPILAGIVLALPLFVTFGLYRPIFRYAGWSALGSVVRACVIYGILYSAIFTAVGVAGVPRTVGIIQPILLFVSVGGARALARLFFSGGLLRLFRQDGRERAFIYGAGAAGRQLAAALADNENIIVVGFIDDDITLSGSVLNGHAIYASDSLDTLLCELAVDSVFLAMPSVSRARRNKILETVRGAPVQVRTLPGLTELAQGKVTVSDLREPDIDDLLGRNAVAPNHLLLGRNSINKIVMVTGAGGSIGSELCRQILVPGPQTLVLVDSSEFSLYSVERDLRARLSADVASETNIVPILASVTNEDRMKGVLSHFQPNIIYHAAAYKHVPMVEHNICEGVGNNVFGTLTMARLAVAFGVRNFVLISTDKAVRPTNVMGASKRLSEMALQSLAATRPLTCFSMVRFGNVLGSSGSVVPLFRQQIRDGGPLTITHEEITRYFMTIPEAAQLVIQAGAMSSGGEVFVLDMGAPIKIIDLARRMIELSGLTIKNDENPDGDIEINFVGLRPGEKLYEELLIGDDPLKTMHPQIMMARDAFLSWKTLEPILDSLKSCVLANKSEMVRKLLERAIKEFTPEERIVDWLHSPNKKILLKPDSITPCDINSTAA